MEHWRLRSHSPGIHRVAQHPSELIPVGTAPLKFARGRPGADPAGQPDIMGGAPGQHTVDAELAVEDVEDQADHGSGFLVGVQCSATIKTRSPRQLGLIVAGDFRPTKVASCYYGAESSSWAKAGPLRPPPPAASGLTPA